MSVYVEGFRIWPRLLVQVCLRFTGVSCLFVERAGSQVCRELFGLRGKLTGVEGVFQERDWPVEVKIGRGSELCYLDLLKGL